MNEGSRRTASCIAGPNGCEMIQISRSAYQKVIAKHSIEYRPQQLHDRAKEITTELLKVSLFLFNFFFALLDVTSIFILFSDSHFSFLSTTPIYVFAGRSKGGACRTNVQARSKSTILSSYGQKYFIIIIFRYEISTFIFQRHFVERRRQN